MISRGGIRVGSPFGRKDRERWREKEAKKKGNSSWN